jgi:hypothetical protein
MEFAQINDLFKNKKNDKKPKKPKTVDIFKVPSGLLKKVKIQQKKVKPKEETVKKEIKNYSIIPKEMKNEKSKKNTDIDISKNEKTAMINRNSNLIRNSYNY